jgi:hypothetical protein
MSLADALKHGAAKICPTCEGRKALPSADGLALIEFLKLPAVARELAQVFSEAIPNPSRPGLQRY